MSNANARYQRSAAGMAGAMIVTLLVIAAFVAFRGANRDDLEIGPEPIDYPSQVAEFVEGPGPKLAHLAELPDGWIATSARMGVDETSSENVWQIDLLTDEGDYVGIRQGAFTDAELLRAANVTREATPGDEVTLEGPVEGWQRWDVEGDDDALIGESGKQRVLVFGSAGVGTLEDVASSLVLS